MTGRENGFRLADSARLCDFLGPHVYPAGDDRLGPRDLIGREPLDDRRIDRHLAAAPHRQDESVAFHAM